MSVSYLLIQGYRLIYSFLLNLLTKSLLNSLSVNHFLITSDLLTRLLKFLLKSLSNQLFNCFLLKLFLSFY